MDRKSRVDAVLSEARVLLAEGEWIRGNYHTRRGVPGVRQVLGREGVTYTSTVDCFCVAGAIYQAVDNLSKEAERADEYGLWQNARLAAFGAVADAAQGLGLVGRGVQFDPLTIVIQTNDRRIENKDQALRWLDAAVADKPLTLS